MTTEELEKKFFETFDIEPRARRVLKSFGFPEPEITVISEYPKITDQKTLELLCICNKHGIYGYSDYGGEYLVGETVEELKENLLENCMRTHMIIYDSVRKLFKERE